jgi:hypothetical protein
LKQFEIESKVKAAHKDIYDLFAEPVEARRFSVA